MSKGLGAKKRSPLLVTRRMGRFLPPGDSRRGYAPRLDGAPVRIFRTRQEALEAYCEVTGEPFTENYWDFTKLAELPTEDEV